GFFQVAHADALHAQAGANLLGDGGAVVEQRLHGPAADDSAAEHADGDGGIRHVSFSPLHRGGWIVTDRTTPARAHYIVGPGASQTAPGSAGVPPALPG